MSRITLAQVAAEAGVSKATAGYILRGQGGNFTPDMRALVTSTAAGLGYRTNAAARATSLGKFQAIGVIQSTAWFPRSILTAPMLAGLHAGAEQAGLTLTMAALDDDHLTDQAQLPHLLRNLSVDGLIMNYNHEIPDNLARLLGDAGIPVTWLNVQQAMDAVFPNDAGGAALAVQHLYACGHRTIVYADDEIGPDNLPEHWHFSMHERERGYREAMQAVGLAPQVLRPALRIEPRDRARHFAAWLAASPRPSAIITYGPVSCRAFQLAAARLQIRIPEDLSLITFADQPVDDLDLSIDTVVLPGREMGQAAVAMLERQIATKTAQQSAVLPCRYVAGQSCRSL